MKKLRIGEFKSNGKLRGSDVVLQFSPSKILGFDTSYHPKTVLKGEINMPQLVLVFLRMMLLKR